MPIKNVLKNIKEAYTPTQRAKSMIDFASLLKRMGNNRRAKELLVEAKEYCQEAKLQRKLDQIDVIEQKWKVSKSRRKKSSSIKISSDL